MCAVLSQSSLIRTTNGDELALSGKLWIEPETGIIMKTSMSVADARVHASSVVTFVKDNNLDFWVPSRMEESYSSNASTITCVATYSRYQRFTGAMDR